MTSRKALSHLWHPAVLSALLACAVAGAYGNSLSNPFVFDDHSYIVDNRDIRAWWPLWRSAEEMHKAPVNGRPVVRLTLALNYALGGVEPAGYRIFNIWAHWAVAVLVLLFVRRTLRSMQIEAAAGLSFVVALWWLLHPLNSECINYVAQRSSILLGLFYMLTLYSARRAMDGDGAIWQWIALLSCALGMGSKESMATAPIAVLLCDRALVSGSFSAALRARYRLYGGLAACWLPLVFLMAQSPHGDTIGFAERVGAWEYLLNQCAVLWTYMAKVFWPYPLIIDYGFARDLTLAEVWWQAVLWVLLLAASVYGSVRNRPGAFAGLACFLVLAPTSSVVPILTEVGAERRMYLPLIALVALVVIGGWQWLNVRLPRRLALWWQWGLGVLVALALGSVAHARNEEFSTPISIWQSAVAATPGNARAHNNLAMAYLEAGQDAKAELHFRRALQCDPAYADAQANLGAVLAERGEVAAAEQHYRSALLSKADHVRALNGLAIGLEGRGQLDSALVYYRAALRIDPYLAEAHINLGALLIRDGFANEGEGHLLRGLALDTSLPQAYYYLGELRESAGDEQAASNWYRRALEVRADYAPAHYRLGNLARAAGDMGSAIAHYNTAVENHPEWVEARYNLATLLAAVQNWPAAITHFSKVIDARPEMVQAHNNIGIALLQTGRTEQALEHFRVALRLAPDYADAQRNLEALLRARP